MKNLMIGLLSLSSLAALADISLLDQRSKVFFSSAGAMSCYAQPCYGWSREKAKIGSAKDAANELGCEVERLHGPVGFRNDTFSYACADRDRINSKPWFHESSGYRKGDELEYTFMSYHGPDIELACGDGGYKIINVTTNNYDRIEADVVCDTDIGSGTPLILP